MRKLLPALLMLWLCGTPTLARAMVDPDLERMSMLAHESCSGKKGVAQTACYTDFREALPSLWRSNVALAEAYRDLDDERIDRLKMARRELFAHLRMKYRRIVLTRAYRDYRP